MSIPMSDDILKLESFINDTTKNCKMKRIRLYDFEGKFYKFVDLGEFDSGNIAPIHFLMKENRSFAKTLTHTVGYMNTQDGLEVEFHYLEIPFEVGILLSQTQNAIDFYKSFIRHDGNRESNKNMSDEKQNPNDISNPDNAMRFAEKMKEGVSLDGALAPVFFNDAEKNWLEKVFGYKHLPPHLQTISKAFADTADFIVCALPPNDERTVALRKLLEAKDAAVRANLL